MFPESIPLLPSGTRTVSKDIVLLCANTVSGPEVDTGTADESGRELGCDGQGPINESFCVCANLGMELFRALVYHGARGGTRRDQYGR
jgi:hypothetical protein